mgnify:CR=1 FL=1
MIAISVFLDEPGILHQGTKAIVEILTDLSDVVDTLYHLIGLIIGIGTSDALLIIFGIEFLNQIAAQIVGVGGRSFPAIVAAAGDLVEIIELVINRLIALAGFVGQVAQRIIGVATVIVAIVFVDRHDAVQRVIGIRYPLLWPRRCIAPHILIDHVAAVVILIHMLLLLHVLAAGGGILDLQQLAGGIVVIILHPAMGIFHPGQAAHAVIGVCGGAAIMLGNRLELPQQVIGLGGSSAVRVGNASLVTRGIVGILYRLTLGISGLGNPVEQVHFKGSGTRPVGHLHQIANLIVLISYLLGIIIVDGCHHIKAIVAIGSHVAIRISLGLEVAIAAVNNCMLYCP